MRTGWLDKSSRSWYLQWGKGNSFAVYRGLKSVTCCMSNRSTWNSKQKVCWDCRKPEKNWLQSRKGPQNIFDFTKKSEREQKTFHNTEFWALLLKWRLETQILESCNCSMWCALQINKISSRKHHIKYVTCVCSLVCQFCSTNAFPFKNKHYNNRKKQNCEDVQLAQKVKLPF